VREGAAVAFNESEPLLSRAPQQGKRLELRDLERAIAKLPTEQRSVVLLVGLEGMRYEEVAAVLGVPVGTVRSRLSRGREALRKLTGADPDYAPGSAGDRMAAASRLHSNGWSTVGRSRSIERAGSPKTPKLPASVGTFGAARLYTS